MINYEPYFFIGCDPKYTGNKNIKIIFVVKQYASIY